MDITEWQQQIDINSSRIRSNEQMMQSDYMVLSGFIDRPLLFTIYSNL